jgi:hypothetical protein
MGEHSRGVLRGILGHKIEDVKGSRENHNMELHDSYCSDIIGVMK